MLLSVLAPPPWMWFLLLKLQWSSGQSCQVVWAQFEVFCLCSHWDLRTLQPQTGGGQSIYCIFHFVFIFILIFSCPSVSFFMRMCVFRLHHHFLHAHLCFSMRDCVYHLRPLKQRLPSHLLLNPLRCPSRLVISFCFALAVVKCAWQSFTRCRN